MPEKGSPVVNNYSDGLRHGWEDAYKIVREILEHDLSDARKLELIAQQVAQQVESTPYAKFEEIEVST